MSRVYSKLQRGPSQLKSNINNNENDEREQKGKSFPAVDLSYSIENSKSFTTQPTRQFKISDVDKNEELGSDTATRVGYINGIEPPPIQRNESLSANSSKISLPSKPENTSKIDTGKHNIYTNYRDDKMCFPDESKAKRIEKNADTLSNLLFNGLVREPYEIMKFMGIHYDDINEIDTIIQQKFNKSIDDQLHILFPGEKNENYILAESYLRNGKLSLAASLELACVGAGKIESEILRICKHIGTNRQEVENELAQHYGKRNPSKLPNGELSSIAYMIDDQHLGNKSLGIECKAYLAFGELRPVDELAIAFAFDSGLYDMLTVLMKYSWAQLKSDFQKSYNDDVERLLSDDRSDPFTELTKNVILGKCDLIYFLRYGLIYFNNNDFLWKLVEHLSTSKSSDYYYVRKEINDKDSNLYLTLKSQLGKNELDKLETYFGYSQKEIDSINSQDILPFGYKIPDKDEVLDKLKQNDGYGKENIESIICNASKAEWVNYSIAYHTKPTFRQHIESNKITDKHNVDMLFSPDITYRILLAAKYEKKDLVIGMIKNYGLTSEIKKYLANNSDFIQYTQGSNDEQKQYHKKERDRWMAFNSKELDRGGEFIENEEKAMRLRLKDYKGFDKSTLSKILIALNQDEKGVKESRKGVDKERSGLGSALWELGSNSGDLLEAYQIDTEVSLIKATEDGIIDNNEHQNIEANNEKTQLIKDYYVTNRDAFENRIQQILEVAVSLALAPFTGGASLLEGMAIKQFGKMVITKTIADVVTKQLSEKIMKGDRAESKLNGKEIANSFISSMLGSILKDVNGLVPNITKNFIEGIPTEVASQIIDGKDINEALAIFLNNIPESLVQNVIQTTILDSKQIKKAIDNYNHKVKSSISTSNNDHSSRVLDSTSESRDSSNHSTDSSSETSSSSENGGRLTYKKPSDYPIHMKLPPREELIILTLRNHGSWKEAIYQLSISDSPLDNAFVQTLVSYREVFFSEQLKGKAKLLGTASTKPESDQDFSFYGDNAGENLLAFEQKMNGLFGANWEKIWRTNFYLEIGRLVDASQYSNKEGGNQFNKEVDDNTEMFNLAHILQNSRGNLEAEKSVRNLIEKLNPSKKAEIERLSLLTESERKKEKDKLIKESDRLVSDRNKFEKGSDAYINLERQIALLQQKINFYTFEADIGHGSFVDSNNRTDQSNYHIILNNLAKIRILSHEYGNLGAAAREYEVFKDMHRIFEVLKNNNRIVLSDKLQMWAYLAEEIGQKDSGDRSLHRDAGYIRQLSDEQLESVTHSFEKGIYELLPQLQEQLKSNESNVVVSIPQLPDVSAIPKPIDPDQDKTPPMGTKIYPKENGSQSADKFIQQATSLVDKDGYITIYHGSVKGFSSIKESGFAKGRGGATYFTTDKSAALDAISSDRVELETKIYEQPNAGLIEIKLTLDQYLELLKLSKSVRDYKGFHGANLKSMEILIQSDQAFDLINMVLISSTK